MGVRLLDNPPRVLAEIRIPLGEEMVSSVQQRDLLPGLLAY